MYLLQQWFDLSDLAATDLAASAAQPTVLLAWTAAQDGVEVDAVGGGGRDGGGEPLVQVGVVHSASSGVVTWSVSGSRAARRASRPSR